MAYRDDYKNTLDVDFPDNVDGDITPLDLRSNLEGLADDVTFRDEININKYSYTRISDDNTSPATGEMSIKSDETKIYIHKLTDQGANIENLFNIIEDGIFSIFMATNTPSEFSVSSVSLSGDVYTLTGTFLTSLISSTGTWYVNFDTNKNAENIVPSARYEVTREADGTATPSTASFAFNASKSQIKISDTLIDDETELFNIMRGGIISVVNKSSKTEIGIFKVTGVGVTGSTYTFSLETLVDVIGSALGDYVLEFNPTNLNIPLTFDFTRVETTSPSTDEFYINSDILYLNTDWSGSIYDLSTMYDDIAKNGGVVLVRNKEIFGSFAQYRVVGQEGAPASADFELKLETILDELGTYDADFDKYTLTFIPSGVSIENQQLKGTELRAEYASSITTTPTSGQISFDNIDLESATEMYFDTSGTNNTNVWKTIKSGDRVFIRFEDDNDGYEPKYAVFVLNGTPVWSSNRITVNITSGRGTSDFTAESGEKFIISFI